MTFLQETHLGDTGECSSIGEIDFERGLLADACKSLSPVSHRMTQVRDVLYEIGSRFDSCFFSMTGVLPAKENFTRLAPFSGWDAGYPSSLFLL
jgi:hypothetical protein